MDPTNKNGGLTDEQLAQMQRPNGAILITWNPNTGAIDFRNNGVTKLEEIGLLQWCLSMRMCDHLQLLGERSAVKIVGPDQLSGFKQ
jgi:hypothetical protein